MLSRVFAIGLVALFSTSTNAKNMYQIEANLGYVHNSSITIQVVVSVSKLNKVSIEINDCLKGGVDIICSVTSQIPYGLNNFNDTPITFLSSLILLVGDREYILETDAMFNPYPIPLDWYAASLPNAYNMMNLTETKKYVQEQITSPTNPSYPILRAKCINKLNCVVRASFNHSACCGYFAGWTIQRGKARRNMIFHSNSLASMVQQHFKDFVNFELAIPVDD